MQLNKSKSGILLINSQVNFTELEKKLKEIEGIPFTE